jgi:hypothetical protein
MVDFDAVHKRYWRCYGRDPDAPIPVRGGDIVERGGKRYAVLHDADGKMVAAYEIVERLFALKDPALVVALITQVEEVGQPRADHADQPRRNRVARLNRRSRRRSLGSY